MRAARCPRCRLHVAACLCGEVSQRSTTTRLVLVAHESELSKTTTTGPLALLALANAELHVHGGLSERLDLSPLLDGERQVLLLFPSVDAEVLDPALVAQDPRPVSLVVPEGTWRQASRMVRRVPGLSAMRKVILPPGPPTRWGVRNETKEGGLATLEAIARAFGILEGAASQDDLERVFDRATAAVMASRQPARAS